MTERVSLNDASSRQLEALLGIDAQTAEALASSRPIAGPDAVAWLPQEALARIGDDLTVAKLDLNEATVDQIAAVARVDPAVASRIVAGRPYYILLELRHVAGIDAETFRRIIEVFGASDISYIDKLTGRRVDLRPDSTKVLVRKKEIDSESGNTFAHRMSLTKLSGRSSSGYEVFAVPETETGASVLRKLKSDASVDWVVPAFSGPAGATQFVDPEYCVVQFEPGLGDAERDAIIAAAGLTVDQQHRSPGLFTLRLRGAADAPGRMELALAALNAAPGVTFAEPGFIAVDDREYGERSDAEAERNQTESGSTLPWNLATLGCATAWATAGKGKPEVIVAVIDSGVDAGHPALSQALLPRAAEVSWNFESDFDPDPHDEDGHGTFIAGLLVGNGQEGIFGICPGCRVLPLRVPLAGATLSYARRRDAILFALQSLADGQRLVLNLSWKTSGDIALIRDAIRQAVENGAIVVCSAGNWPSAFDEPHYPSDYDTVLSVAAVGADGAPAGYSFLGSRIDLCAPGGSGPDGAAGDNILSAARGGGAAVDFGTSFAAPHIAGAAALLMSQRPGLTSSAVAGVLAETAARLDAPGTGSGLLRMDRAVGAGSVSPIREPDAPTAPPGLAAVNQWDAARLAQTFGLLAITARIIKARCPHAALSDLAGIIGLSEVQFQRIAGFAGPV